MSNDPRPCLLAERLVTLGIGLALVLSSLGCTTERRGFDPGNASGPFGSKDGGTGDSVFPDGCTAAARLVYVLSRESELYSFTPNLGTFTKIGLLECPTAGLATPNSMAIDRNGTAWVNYGDGTLFKVSTADAHCVATNFEPNQEGFLKFGMAFATDGEGGAAETLYISRLDSPRSGGRGLGKIDLGTMKVSVLGDYSGNLGGEGAELTGTGDGRLFGFFTTDPATLAEIDKAKGATSGNRSLDGVDTGTAWAFSFWGGDFWFYTSDGIHPSRVTQLKTSSAGEISVVVSDVGGFRIVGAGVSTCAPTTPPK